MHLLDQRIEIRELQFFTQLLDEFDVNVLAINIFVEIENVSLEQRFCSVDSGPRPQGGNAVQRFILESENTRGEDTHQRDLASVGIDICCRVSKASSQVIPFYNLAGHPVSPTQQGGCPLQITGG